MFIPKIIFSFIIKNGEVISTTEHDSLYDAEKYVGFKIKEYTESERCLYYIMPESGSNLFLNATWVANFKYDDIDITTNNVKETHLIETALKMVIREKVISKILDDEDS